jgi:pyruvate, orthophosphate dikinase
MMDTVLNLGPQRGDAAGADRLTGNERFGWDAYRRFVAMFGRIVLGVEGRRLRRAARGAQAQARGVKADL